MLLQFYAFSNESSALSDREKLLISHVKESINKAEKLQSKLIPSIMKIHGMSSPKVRHLLNNVCSLPQTTYLEIGSWKGSTLVGALYKNNESVIDAVAIENFSEFGGPRAEFNHHRYSFIKDAHLHFYEVDAFNVDPTTLCEYPINVYFYDGGHSPLEQMKAFTSYNQVFDDVFIAIVDDWNWGDVRSGTAGAFQKLGYKILYERALFTNANGDMDSWWNGIYIAVIRK